MVASSYSCNPSEEKMDDEAAPLLRLKHESSQPSSSSSSSPWSFFPDEGNNVVKSIIPVKMMVLLTILSGLLVFIACCDHMDMNGSMSMGGHVNKDHTSPTMVNDISSADSTISGTNVNNNGDSSDSSSSFGETLENMFTSLVHDIEQPGDIKGFAPDIMKMLENNYTNDIDYGYGMYDLVYSFRSTKCALFNQTSFHVSSLSIFRCI